MQNLSVGCGNPVLISTRPPRVFWWGMRRDKHVTDPCQSLPMPRAMPHQKTSGVVLFALSDWTQVDRSYGRRNCVERRRGNHPKPTLNEWASNGCAGTGRWGAATARNPASERGCAPFVPSAYVHLAPPLEGSSLTPLTGGLGESFPSSTDPFTILEPSSSRAAVS